MEHKEVKLSKKTIYSKQSGINYVEMLVPENWNIGITNYKETYGGYSCPYTFRIKLSSPDNTVSLYFFSPRIYLDDHLMSYSNNQIDDYGNLLRKFESVEEYLGKWADNDLKDMADVKEKDKITYSNTRKLKAEHKEKALEKARKHEEQLDDFYYDRITRVYSYKYKDTERIRLFSGLIEAEKTSKFRIIPVPDNVMDRNFVIASMMSAFPDMRYNEKTGNYVRCSQSETSWSARCLFLFDCMAKDYEFAYKTIFSPVINQGVTICDDIWKDFERIKKENDARYQKIREEKREVARIQREANEARRKSNQETYDYLRKTQQEIHDIQKSAYENQRKTQNKVSEMWGDVNQGNTRFVDRDGREHVIHTYDNYAYKRGDTYVTSNSPWDHPYDFEELEKKKY